jgi:hypothetical protein
MLVVGEKAAQANAESVMETRKTNESSVDVETIPTTNDTDEALQHLERLRKQYGVGDDACFNFLILSTGGSNGSALF